MSRIVAANWKMNGTRADWRTWARKAQENAQGLNNVTPVLCVPAPALADVVDHIGPQVKLGGQDVHPAKEGAHTGYISAGMLKEFQCNYCIIGHSERRHYESLIETNAAIANKAQALIDDDIVPILCVGESLSLREAGQAAQAVYDQLEECLHKVLVDDPAELVIAYEPVWAISAAGSGRTPTTDEIDEIFQTIRTLLMGKYGDMGKDIKILYGGSVKPENIHSILDIHGVGGVLVGAASLKTEVFAELMRLADR